MNQKTTTTPRKEPKLLAGRGATARSALIVPIAIARWMVLLVLLAGIYFFHTFLVPVLAALVIGFASWPLYRWLLKKVGGNRTLGASIAIMSIIGFLVVPVTVVLTYAFHEIRVWFAWLIKTNNEGSSIPKWMVDFPLGGDWLQQVWVEYIGEPGALGHVVQMVSGANIGNIYRAVLAASGSVFHLFLAAVFMLITLFFIYKDGEKFAAQLDRLGERILPVRWERISRVVPATISSTVMGMTLIAIGEGIVLGLAYWIAGVPTPVLLGVITGVMALIPGGAPLSFTLVSLYLVGNGDVVPGIALFTWGSVELFIVDKTLRPKLVGGPVKLPFLPTFFGLIGGVKTMGFLGLFIGPVLMALLVMIWREWVREAEEDSRELEAERQLSADTPVTE